MSVISLKASSSCLLVVARVWTLKKLVDGTIACEEPSNGSVDMHLYSIQDRYTKDDQEVKLNHTDGIIVPKFLWERWIHTCRTTMLVRISQGELQQICTVAAYHDEGAEVLYVPEWMFYKLKRDDPCTIDELWDEEDEEDPLPLATKIHLRPLDSELYHTNIEEEVSKYLSNFQCLQQGTTLVVPIESLGGYLVDIFVEMCEPEGEVLLRGEVALELLAPLEDVAEWQPTQEHSQPAPKPVPQPAPQTQATTDFTSMFDTVAPPIQQKYFTGQGHRLG